MAIFSQTLKDILQMIETFKAQLNDIFHEFVDSVRYNLNDSFNSAITI
jgi:hypothetical protein